MEKFPSKWETNGNYDAFGRGEEFLTLTGECREKNSYGWGEGVEVTFRD
jgi:hypothetical protein